MYSSLASANIVYAYDTCAPVMFAQLVALPTLYVSHILKFNLDGNITGHFLLS